MSPGPFGHPPTTNDAPSWLVDLLYNPPGWLTAALGLALVVLAVALAVGARRVDPDEELLKSYARWTGPMVSMGVATMFVRELASPSYVVTVAAGVAVGAAVWYGVGLRTADKIIEEARADQA